MARLICLLAILHFAAGGSNSRPANVQMMNTTSTASDIDIGYFLARQRLHGRFISVQK
jgi:hypothetical protein